MAGNQQHVPLSYSQYINDHSSGPAAAPLNTNGVVIDGPYKGWNVRIDRREGDEHLVSVWKGEFDLFPVLDTTDLERWFEVNPTRWPIGGDAPPIGVIGRLCCGVTENENEKVLIHELPSDEGGYVVIQFSSREECTTTLGFADAADLLAWYSTVDIDWSAG